LKDTKNNEDRIINKLKIRIAAIFTLTAAVLLAPSTGFTAAKTGMASQIGITGAIHYANKAVSGQRLALHALKNQ
jgi:hypothetical protein